MYNKQDMPNINKIKNIKEKYLTKEKEKSTNI